MHNVCIYNETKIFVFKNLTSFMYYFSHFVIEETETLGD